MLGWINLSNGGTTGTVVDVKVIYSIALITITNSIVLAHNYPSGNAQPSETDKNITKVIFEAGKLFSIGLIDHIIITPDKNYYSFIYEGNIKKIKSIVHSFLFIIFFLFFLIFFSSFFNFPIFPMPCKTNFIPCDKIMRLTFKIPITNRRA